MTTVTTVVAHICGRKSKPELKMRTPLFPFNAFQPFSIEQLSAVLVLFISDQVISRRPPSLNIILYYRRFLANGYGTDLLLTLNQSTATFTWDAKTGVYHWSLPPFYHYKRERKNERYNNNSSNNNNNSNVKTTECCLCLYIIRHRLSKLF